MKNGIYRALRYYTLRTYMLHRDGHYSEARFSCTAQVIRNNQNILNNEKAIYGPKTLEDKSGIQNRGRKNKRGMCSVSSSNFATVSPFSRQRFLGFYGL